MVYTSDMKDMSRRIGKSIRMKEDIYHQARVAAVMSRKSLGQWIEKAVTEKLQREAAADVVGSRSDKAPSL